MIAIRTRRAFTRRVEPNTHENLARMST